MLGELFRDMYWDDILQYLRQKVTWKPCSLPATIRPPNEVVKEVAQLWDQLQFGQLLLHLLPVLPHQKQPQNIEDLHPID